MEDQVHDLLQLFSRFATPSASLARIELLHLDKLCEAYKHTCDEEVDDFVCKQHAAHPLLVQYQDDGSTHTVRVRHTLRAGNSHTSREGMYTPEFLSEREFISCHPKLDARPHRILLREPRTLLDGGSGWHVWGARIKGFKSMWKRGHRGTVCYAYGFDRKLFRVLARLAPRFREMLIQLEVAEPERGRASLHCFVLCRPCTSHYLHNSSEWGMLSLCSPQWKLFLFIPVARQDLGL
jgi:hypothetical protein